MPLSDKIEKLCLSSCADDSEVYAVPGQNSIIDTINAATGLSRICGETAEQIVARNPGAVRMTWDAWREAAIARQETPIRWLRTTRRKFDEMLNVLPPIDWNGYAFLVGEPTDHSFRDGKPRYQAYRKVDNGQHYVPCYASSRPLTRAELRAELTKGL